MALSKDLADSPEDIIKYLRNHPDFFVEHTDILSELNLPHDTGNVASPTNVASLIEYQIAQLRFENASLNNNLEKSEEDVLHQRELVNNVHDLSIQLMQVDSLETLNDLLSKSLKRFYKAEQFLFLIFQKPVACKDSSNIRFLEANSKLAFMFTELYHHNKPLCDSLQTEHIEALFQAETESIHSTALIPVQQSAWHGLFVLGSKVQDQYSHGFKIDLLRYITMISAALVESIVFKDSSKKQGEISS
ncbi:MAG: DUF484 family protein [Gammaproteobacteria bacterium]